MEFTLNLHEFIEWRLWNCHLLHSINHWWNNGSWITNHWNYWITKPHYFTWQKIHGFAKHPDSTFPPVLEMSHNWKVNRLWLTNLERRTGPVKKWHINMCKRNSLRQYCNGADEKACHWIRQQPSLVLLYFEKQPLRESESCAQIVGFAFLSWLDYDLRKAVEDREAWILPAIHKVSKTGRAFMSSVRIMGNGKRTPHCDGLIESMKYP